MENLLFNQAKKEQLNSSLLRKNNLESSVFRLHNDFVFYFNCNLERSAVDLYIEKNFEFLIKSFQSIGKKLIIVNNQSVAVSEIEILQYYFPNLQVLNKPLNKSQSLLDYFYYTGTIQIGLIAVCPSNKNYLEEVSIIEINPDYNLDQLEQFFVDYFKHLQVNEGFVFEPVTYERSVALYSPIFYKPDDFELSNEDSTEIQLIVDKLNQIKSKGNFIALLPILENHLQNQKVNNTKLSKIYIDQDYKIWLSDYNLEVKLSHLTKSIYFLFLAMEHEIYLSDLSKHKKELINIYLSISNQENLDKLLQSIDLLLNDKKAIYVHLSRIKAAFHKLVFKDIAVNYCIQGAKEEPKFIVLPKRLTNINSFLQQWEIDPKIYLSHEEIDDFDWRNPDNYDKLDL